MIYRKIMEEKKLVPEIRFKGYDEAWNSLPFSKIVNRSSSISFDETVPSVEYEDILSGEGRLNKDIHQKTIHKTGQRFSNGDILFGKLRPYLRNNLLSDFEGIAVGDFWIFKEGLAKTDFVYPFIYSHDFDFISNISSGSKMPRSDWQLISVWNFNIPLNSNEQQEIGKYFKKLDGLIADTEKEIERLEKLKTASLQKMFPQPDESVPQIRFKGFTEPWKKYKLGDILVIGNGRDYKHLNDGNIPVFGTGGLMTYVDDYLYDGESVFIGRKGTIDKPYYFKGKFWTVDTLFYTHSFKNSIPLFLYPLFQTIDWNNHNMATGVPSLSKDTIEQIIVVSPTLEEQKAIGEYFRNLDNIIKKKKKKVSQLRNLKKASLSKMFVNTAKQ